MSSEQKQRNGLMKLQMDFDPSFVVEIYYDKKKQLRWRVSALNNKTVADSSESYKNLTDINDIVQRLFQGRFKLRYAPHPRDVEKNRLIRERAKNRRKKA